MLTVFDLLQAFREASLRPAGQRLCLGFGGGGELGIPGYGSRKVGLDF